MLNSNLLRKLDMQDLIVFVHVYERSSVTQVSDALCVSQSTVSYCLKKLRVGLEDDLFIPSRGGMKPTDKASKIYPHIVQILESINLCHTGAPVYKPGEETSVFTVHAPEYFELLVLPKLLSQFHAKKLPVIVNVEKFGHEIPVEEMKTGAIDLVICFGPNYHRKHAGLKSRTLLEDDLVCVADSGHAPLRGALDMDEFLARRHVYPTPWTSTTNMVDGWLSKKGLRREIIARANTYNSAIGLLKGTNFLLTLPTRVVSHLCNEDWIACCEPPAGLPSFTLNMLWNDRMDRDAGNSWFREQILQVTSGMI